MPREPRDPNAWLKVSINDVKFRVKQIQGQKKPRGSSKGRPIKNVKDSRLTGKLMIPEHLLNRRLTAKSLTSSNYREKLLAAVYPQFAITGLQELHEAGKKGNIAATYKKLEICGFTSPKSGVSIINNMYDARSVNLDARDEIAEGRDFEGLARKLAKLREDRMIQVPGIPIDISAASPTPERVSSPNYENE